MKYQLFSYIANDAETRPGIRFDDRHHDLRDVARRYHSILPADITVDDLIDDWADSQAALTHIVERLSEDVSASDVNTLDEANLRFAAPLQRAGAIYGAGANYRDHVEAMSRAFNMNLVLDPRGQGIPPWHFLKSPRATLTGHRSTIPYPANTTKLDWEAELAVIIGRKASDVSVEEALDYVAGYSCSNDVSARDQLVRQDVDPTSPFKFDWIGHKCFTGSCPVGPYLTPSAFVESPEHLDIKLWVNGELKQDSNTRNHLYSVADQIAYLSKRLVLYPGDIILTGTPAGVGMERGTFLSKGDVMRVWIDGLGELENAVL
ncbi:fumarylacetoacetate hydrolase family protein [Burkholderia multivorans]|uniref:fumarylacetoacetate hydrolase family protein n=1 Tax=Burkholderia multivorans TaxID=87883 RepID=UPI001C247720|nr:fumarylacetoacetate hydrolase family protein [Burkholderia multivorans]MBU9212358.1 fumarylacetoacetate hydrolase family protein [Burkholderia multivorans]